MRLQQRIHGVQLRRLLLVSLRVGLAFALALMHLCDTDSAARQPLELVTSTATHTSATRT